jgi:hypothetical protein
MKKILVIIFIMGMTTITFGGVRYHPTDITKVATDACAPIIPVYGYAINDACMVTGHGTTSTVENSSKPYLYNPSTGSFTNIGNLAGNFTDGYGGNGYAINNQGFVTGRDSDSNTSWTYKAFVFGDINLNGVVDTGELLNLNPEGGSHTGNDINIHNQVVGYNSTTSIGWVWTDLNSNYQYDEGEKQSFAGLDPMSINDSGTMILASTSTGQVILWKDSNSNGVYEDSEKQTMPMPSGTYTSMTGNSINNNGDVCGYVRNSGTSKNQGFYWTDNNHNGLVDTNEYSVFATTLRNTYVRAMNDRSELVGGTYEWDPSNSLRSAFVWTAANGMVNLNDVCSYTDATLGPVIFSQAEGINNNGAIVTPGFFDLDHNGRKGALEPEHAFVLTPYIPGDLDNSKNVDFKDYSLLSASYGSTTCSQGNGYCNGADINGDGSVDLKDMKILTENWLSENN